MVDNPTKIYNDYVRANLPNSMSYDTGTDRYDINSHSFFKFKNSNWYFNYISKYGYSALSAYAVNGLEPALVFDFKGNYFRKSATDSTFGASITHAASTNATMVDSDGLLKWRPHNVAKYSEDFTNAAWLIDAAGITKTATEITETATTTLHYTRQSMSVVGGRYTATVDLKPNGRQWAWLYADTLSTATAYFDLTNGVVGSTVGTGVTSSIIDLGDGYFRCTMSKTSALSANFGFGLSTADGTTSYLGDVTKSLFARKVHAFRSDLGGMVNNPDTSSSYVPTTSAAVYAPRRGHHVYNGSAWVNEGILHESEARTNLLLNSGDVIGTGWVAQGSGGSIAGSVTAGSPFGTYQTVTPSASDNANPAQRYQIGKSITSGQTYVSSALLKHSVGTFWTVVDVYDTVTGNKRAYFDLQNGVVGTKDASVLQSGMIDYGDGWWLCWASATVASNSGGLNVELTKGDGILGRTFGDVMLVAGSQFELGSTPSSYIPTVIATTRAAETLTVPAANLPYNSTNMSIQMDGKMTYADTDGDNGKFFRWHLDNSNNIYSMLSTYQSRTGAIYWVQESGNVLDAVTGPATSYSPDTNVPFNFASRHGSTFLNGAIDGTALTANTTPTALPDLSATDLNLGYTFMGTIGEFRMWDEDLGDVGITEATLPSTEPSLSLTFDGSETSFIVLDWSE